MHWLWCLYISLPNESIKINKMEIEIRAEINNIADIEKKLIGLGAKLVKRKKQVDKYFGEINLFKKIGYSFMMRVRNEGDKNYLTYKGAASKKDGVWEEYEFEIVNGDVAQKMLTAMGLEEIIQVRKNRIEYKLDNLSICLDNIAELGNFIEIESQDDNDVDKAELKKIMEKLNINENKIINKGYITLLLIKNKSPFSEYIVN